MPSGVRRLREVDLFAAGVGYGDAGIRARAERCACGGLIRVEDRDDEWLVRRALGAHYAGREHERWAIAAGLR